MTNTDNFIKGVFTISSITLAVLVILSSIAIISNASSPSGAIIDENQVEESIPAPAIMIDNPPGFSDEDIALAYLQESSGAIQFIEFPPMHINVQPLLNN